MNFFISCRGGGKSTKCIEWLWRDPNHYIVVANQTERQHLIQMARRHPRARRVAPNDEQAFEHAKRHIIAVTFASDIGRNLPGGAVLMVDNVEHVLGRLLGRPISGITGTDDAAVRLYE